MTSFYKGYFFFTAFYGYILVVSVMGWIVFPQNSYVEILIPSISE